MTIAEANKPFAEGVQELLASKGFKKIYIAEKAGYTAQELSDMLNGRRIIKACDIPRLARALGVKADEIYSAGMESETGEKHIGASGRSGSCGQAQGKGNLQ